ncbi:unnamed protein product [Malus baccata var. baccata]
MNMMENHPWRPQRGLPESLAGTRTARLRPRPKMVQKTDMYAGSAFAVSPEPSSLPLSSFSRKKQVLKVVDDDLATRDLRRLL